MRADYGAEDRIKATIDRIAKLRVPVNSSFVLLTGEDAFVLETIASEIGADQEKIDNCIDEDDEVEIKLTSRRSVRAKTRSTRRL